MRKRNLMNKDEINRGMKEFESAWKEFFKNKPKPKNDEEEKKEQEEFIEWYNNARKQSDTGKTPAEMFKEIYGKEPGKWNEEPSRIMTFEWDEDYKEPDEFLHEANIMINKGNYKEALKLIDEFFEIVPKDDEALLMKAEALNCLGKYEEAEYCLKRVEKSGNLKAYASFYRAQRYMFEGNFIKAEKCIKDSYEEDPGNFDFLIGMANYLYLENDRHYQEYIETAKRIDTKRTKRFLKNSWIEPKELINAPFLAVFLECVDTLMSEKKAEEAEKNLSWVILHEQYIEKEIAKVLRGLHIETLFMQEKVDDAIIKIEELKKIDKNNPHAYYYMAEILLYQGKKEEALKEIDECLRKVEKKNMPFPHPDFLMMKSRILKKMDSDDYIYYENKARELMKGTKVLANAFKNFKEFMKEGDEL